MKVFYNESCSICRAEINLYKKHINPNFNNLKTINKIEPIEKLITILILTLLIT